MGGENIVNDVMPGLFGTICVEALTLKLFVNLYPDEDERAPGFLCNLTPSVSDKARAPGVVHHDLAMLNQQLADPIVSDLVCGRPLFQWDALAAVQSPLQVDRVKANQLSI